MRKVLPCVPTRHLKDLSVRRQGSTTVGTNGKRQKIKVTAESQSNHRGLTACEKLGRNSEFPVRDIGTSEIGYFFAEYDASQGTDRADPSHKETGQSKTS